MSLCLNNNTLIISCLQRVITPLYNYHTKAVTTSRYQHHLGLVALNLTSMSEMRTPASKFLEKLPTSMCRSMPTLTGMTTSSTPTWNSPSNGSTSWSTTPTLTS